MASGPISQTYNPDDYRLPLTAEQEQELIDAATLEAYFREPAYWETLEGFQEAFNWMVDFPIE